MLIVFMCISFFYFRNFYLHIIFHIIRFFFQHMNGIPITFTSNGALASSVTGGSGEPVGSVTNPKGGEFVFLERR